MQKSLSSKILSRRLNTSLIALFVFLFLISFECVIAQTYVDTNGVVKWTDSEKEVCHFGVNYAIPFSYWDLRAPIGADYHKAIDEDVYHMARLGLDAYRLHVWQGYITDENGNLVYNEHFELLDYLFFKLKERGIKLFITCIYGGEGGGYTSKFKNNCLDNGDCWPLQENYLKQFVSHVNPYTGVSYKDDKDVVAFAIHNEPGHFRNPEQTTTYINTMYDAIKSTGCSKPIFYNITTSADQKDQILASKVEGATFQWYPTGLTGNHNLEGNMLPNVDKYQIDFQDKLTERKTPKFVYEFSPADVGKSATMYVAMARSFREAGFQFATQFAYDPIHAAYSNIEYRTHFLNLAYTPKKAIGMMIAKEAFHYIELGKLQERYPYNNSFGPFRLEPETDLAEMLTDKKFLYSTSTTTLPKKAIKLEQVAGTGSSPIVKYEGTGAYFLDKVETGVWRLEVMPDALWVKDPFFVPYLEREVAVVQSNSNTMEINLPDLGSNFSLKGLNNGNNTESMASGNSLKINPGSYLLVRSGITTDKGVNDKIGSIELGEFHAPNRKSATTYLVHKSKTEIALGQNLIINADVISPDKIEEVYVTVLKVGGGINYSMTKNGPFGYYVNLPSDILEKESILRYHITVKTDKKLIVYPSGYEGEALLNRRKYSGDLALDDHGNPYEVNIVGENRPILLFEAEKDWDKIVKPNRYDLIEKYPSPNAITSEIRLESKNFKGDDEMKMIRLFCADKISGRTPHLNNKKELVVEGHSLTENAETLSVTFILKDATAYSATLKISNHSQFETLNINDFKLGKMALLPRPYPNKTGLPFWFETKKPSDFNLSEIEHITLGITKDTPEDKGKNRGVAINKIYIR